MDNPYAQFAQQPVSAPTMPVATGENPYAQFVQQPVSAPPVQSDTQWQKALQASQDLTNAPFAGLTRAFGDTAMGAVQGAAQIANKVGLTNNLGDKISEMKADNDKDTDQYYAGKPVSKGLDVAGNVAGNAAEFALMGGAGDTGILGNTVVGAAQGAMQIGTPEEKLKNSEEGGMAAFGGTLGAKIAGKFLQEPEAMTVAKQKAKDLVNKVLATDGTSPEEIAQKLEQTKDTNLPLTVADLVRNEAGTQGRNTLGMLNAAVNRPGGAASEAAQLADRVGTRGDRVRQMYDQTLSSTSKSDIMNQSEKMVSDQAGPAYEKAFAQNPVYSDDIKEALKNPDVTSGIPLGIRIQRNEAYGQGKPFQPYDEAEIGRNVTDTTPPANPLLGKNFQSGSEINTPETGQVPNMRLLDAAKKGLDAKIEAETDPVTGKVTQLGRSLIQTKQRFLGEVDAINPDYAKARQIYGDAASRSSAFERGRNFMKQDPEDITSFLHGDATNGIEPASDAEKGAYYAGARRNMEDVADRINDSSNFGKNLWKQNYQKRMSAMFPEGNQVDTMGNLMGHEQAMANTDAILGNSMTAPRMEYGKMLDEAGTGSGLAQKGAHAVNWMLHPGRAASNFGANMLEGHLKKQASAMSGDVAHEVSKYLLSKDPTYVRSLSTPTAMSAPSWLNATPAVTTGIATTGEQ